MDRIDGSSEGEIDAQSFNGAARAGSIPVDAPAGAHIQGIGGSQDPDGVGGRAAEPGESRVAVTPAGGKIAALLWMKCQPRVLPVTGCLFFWTIAWRR
jgi:hypothetical protein